MAHCRQMLKQLLITQKEVKANAPEGENTTLITEPELHEIRRLWRTERGDWEDSVPGIVREVLGKDLDWVSEDAVAFTAADGELLDMVCAKNGAPTELVVRLLDIERASHGLKRRHGVHTGIEVAFRREWRDIDEIIAERRTLLGEGGQDVDPDEDALDRADNAEGLTQ
jgi:DNA sulfur modification protein DndC